MASSGNVTSKLTSSVFNARWFICREALSFYQLKQIILLSWLVRFRMDGQIANKVLAELLELIRTLKKSDVTVDTKLENM